jgi:hypothetical protein
MTTSVLKMHAECATTDAVYSLYSRSVFGGDVSVSATAQLVEDGLFRHGAYRDVSPWIVNKLVDWALPRFKNQLAIKERICASRRTSRNG